MSDDSLTETLTDNDADFSAETAGAIDASDDGPTAAGQAIVAMGLTKMSLQELKEKPAADLVAFAEALEIENANSMLKQDIMFAILKAVAEEGVDISGSGTLEV